MAKNSTALSATADREISITRLFNAPRDLVFTVWTEQKHLDAWWGPDGFRNTTHEIDVRPGGVWRFTMHGPDGVDYPNRVSFLEVVRPERLVFLQGNDSMENPVRVHFHVTVLFEERGAQTEITMTMVFETSAERTMVAEQYGAVEGQQQHMNRLEKYLGSL